ncbi:cupin domain-containing protein [Parafrankia sp. EUN1f]|uniref:cupin domain-containing protein n=1 Tax=Parafrankia sp. EUN1f TaxID=102897 RepID=UPI0001C446DF|nr:cupin domain-containing protein [Parafrankia sp. EUN1f]EFC84108.1 protein of unknown function DUF985 [Parafrankia sp. EUN1f]
MAEPRPVPVPHPLIEALGLAPHPEGGWYRRTWQSPLELDAHGGVRPMATAISFLLLPGEVSHWHRVRSDELWFWQGGGALLLTEGGARDAPGATTGYRLGPEPAVSGAERVQHLVPANVWQTARPTGAEHVLVGCVVAPGFDFADFELLDTPG